ncbi:MAG: ABC transporter ATP-binding protein [Clostridiales bacterium]|nr:ABC transporter ATP-binding protein [Clostridiales bacterium]
MLKIFKYMKKSAASIVLVFLLLVVQAICDLSLPDFTSDIVNVGIQQSGIKNAAPDVIRQSEYDKLSLFLGTADKETVDSHYRLLDRSQLSDKEVASLSKKYPVLAEEPLYQLDTKDKDIIEKLSSLMSKPIIAVSVLSSDDESTAGIREKISEGMASGGSAPMEIPEGMDPEAAAADGAQMTPEQLFAALAQMPQEARDQMIKQFDEAFSQMPESMISQSAVLYVKQEYKAVGMDTDAMQTRYILWSGAKMLLVALLSMAATVTVSFFAARIAASLGRELRGRVFGKVVSFSQAEFDKFSTASLITRSTNDIQQIQMLMVMLLRVVFYAPIVGVGGVLKVINTNSTMSWIIAVAVAAILSLVVVLFAVVMPRFQLMQKLVDKLNLVTREILTGLPVIRAFSTEKHEEKRFDEANRNLTRTNLFVNRVMSSMMPLMMLLMNGITILIMWNGAHSIDDGVMQVGNMMAFIQYTMQIVMSFLMISMVSIMLPRAAVSGKRISEVLDTDVTVKDPDVPVSFDGNNKGVVEFRNVSFRYPGADEDVLTNIDFVAKPGETTAFIGSTGSGKSTLVNLIPRFFDVTDGEILVDGVDIRRVSQHDLRERIGYVPQKGVLFSGTIESNVKYGCPDAPDEEMERAARIAQATEFIEAKPDGYDSEISQGGDNVSGGQKQRLSIARAVAKRPEIYIFDDSFSALDFKTDASLRAALKKETSDSTVLIVAQRISTILHAEQILVLDEGRVVGKGTHKELLESCDTYRQIATSQLSKEELAHE